ncbi:MAG: hypothetical protein KC422_22295 [Trueperaceae bacterium]|nr:hypothetical protein [Trueperaceae bacterium]
MRLLTFGGLRLEGSDFRSEQPLFILAYLTLQASVPRARIAELFWPHQIDNTKRVKSLSDCLSRLANQGIAIAKRDASLISTLNADVLELESAYQLGNLDSVLALYKGTFMAGVEANKRWHIGEELEDWLNLNRERYQALFVDAALNKLESYLNSKQLAPIPALLKRLIDLPQEVYPFSAQELSRLSLIVSTSGQNGFEVQLARLRQELAEPLFEPLVGRQTETTTLVNLVLQEHQVLIHGLAGVGKTTLLEHLEGHLKRFFDCSFLRLGTLEKTATLADLLHFFSQSLRVSFASQELLFHYFAQRKVLLLLDNLEHLSQFEPFWQDFLNACPNLHILASSRSKLNSFRNVYELTPLSPEAALALLDQEFKRSGIFAPALETKEGLSKLLGYLPLALKLSVPWFKVLPEATILKRLRQGLDLLRDQHVSLHALIQESIALLNEDAKTLFLNLSVFRGGFDFEALSKIMHSPETQLRTLVESSLLSFNPASQRYDFHPLISVFLESAPSSLGLDHAKYYLSLLSTKESREKLQKDLANLEKAWTYLLTEAAQELLSYAPFLRFLADESPSLNLCLRLAEKLYQRFPQKPPSLLAISWLKLRAGHYSEVEPFAQMALDFADNSAEKCLALNALGAVADLRTDFEGAKASFEQVLDLAKSDNERCSALLNLAVSCLNQGNLQEAYAYLASATNCSSLRKDYLKGWFLFLNHKALEAKIVFELLGAKAESQNLENLVFQVKPKLIRCLIALGEREEALELCQTSLLAAKQRGLFRSELALETCLGDIFLAKANYSGAFRQYLYALNFCKEVALASGFLGLFVKLITSHKLEPEFSSQLLGFCLNKKRQILYEDRLILQSLEVPKENSDALLHLNEKELAELILLRYQA